MPILRQTNDPLNLAEAMWVQGQIAARRHYTTAALTSFEEAIANAESIRNRLTAPTSQIRYRATIDAIYAAPVILHLAMTMPPAAFTAAERGRARVGRSPCRSVTQTSCGQLKEPIRKAQETLPASRCTLRSGNPGRPAGPCPPMKSNGSNTELATLDRRIELEEPASRVSP
ncbi:MAG: hypothetical protein IPK16_28145 [Anaerolineales bacterium]|nr:hypothetical protein [Anaerolineales bacterium]